MSIFVYLTIFLKICVYRLCSGVSGPLRREIVTNPIKFITFMQLVAKVRSVVESNHIGE